MSECDWEEKMISITKDTKLIEILRAYPWLKDELIKVNEKFKLLNTPLGKIMVKKATISDMSKKSGIDTDKIILKLREMIASHG